MTARVFRIVLDSLKHYRSFLEHENLCFLVDQSGVDIGDRLHGRKTSASMLETIYAVQREQTIRFVTTPNKHTRCLPYVGIAADKVCDKQFASWEIVNGRVNLLGTPVSFIMELRAVTSESADADTCLAEIDGAADGLRLVASQRRSYCFDGEACYQGEVTAVKAQLLRRSSKTTVWHDPPHANELLNGDMRSDFNYISTIHELLRQIYSYYSRSPKKLRGLVAAAEELGEDYAALHYVFEVRMVESETVALKNFLTDLPFIVIDLTQTIAEADGTPAATTVQISKCRSWLRQIRQFKFVAVLIVLLDSNELSRKFSKATQADDGLAIDVPHHLTQLTTKLTARRDGALGPKLARNLRQLCKGKFGSVELLGVPQTDAEQEAATADAASHLPAELANAPDHDEIWPVEEIIDHKAVGRGFQYLVWWKDYPRAEATWERRVFLRPDDINAYWEALRLQAQAAAAPPSAPPSPPGSPPPTTPPSPPPSPAPNQAPPSDDDSEEDIPISELAADWLAKLKADLGDHPAFVRVLLYQRTICDSLLRHLPERLVIPEVVTHLATVTDFRRMPLESTSKASQDLETWGNDSIDWLVANVLTHLDADTLRAEALRARLFVREHKQQWMLEHKVVGEDGKVMGSEVRLTLTGEEGIAHSLFTEPERISGGVPHQFLELLDFMISFRFNQSDTERAGRTMTLTKPALRSSLGDEHFKQACWVAFNSPGFHELDIMALVKRWKRDGHLSAVMKDEGALRAREVRGRCSSVRLATTR